LSYLIVSKDVKKRLSTRRKKKKEKEKEKEKEKNSSKSRMESLAK
jgi:hypothetical protein